jgi:pyridoxine/pyridoxamine 5'-phosphate oxidase
MPDARAPAATARSIIDANRYLTLATADADGRPWASPVWFAHAGHRELFWLSDPAARHSRNIAARPEVAVVVFDSQVPIGTGQAVYLEGLAEQLDDAGLERALAVVSGRSQAHGGRAFSAADVRAPARLRLWCVVVHEAHLGGRDDRRIRVDLDAPAGS